MLNIEIGIEGISPLLMNRFTDAEMLKVDGGTSLVMNGDKGTPRERASAKVYGTPERPALPGANIYRSIIDAGRFHKSGKEKMTTQKSSLIPSGVWLVSIECPISPAAWEVDSRPVVIPATGGRVIAHRPRFDVWSLSFTLSVDEGTFSDKMVRTLVDDAGSKIGLGDFRPARKGPFGRYKVVSWRSEKA